MAHRGVVHAPGQHSSAREVSLFSAVGTTRVVLIALDTPAPETLRVLLNPASLKVDVGANWPRQVVVGLPYEVMQYSHTKNIEVACQFFYSEHERNRQERATLEPPFSLEGFGTRDAYRNFFMALAYPEEAGGTPSRVRFAWPKVWSFDAVLESVSFNYTQFRTNGRPVYYTADCRFVEIGGFHTAPGVRMARGGGFVTAGGVPTVNPLTFFGVRTQVNRPQMGHTATVANSSLGAAAFAGLGQLKP